MVGCAGIPGIGVSLIGRLSKAAALPKPKMPQKAPPGVVVGYVRVSTDQQADSGAGMAAQRAAICVVCLQNGWELGQIYEDAGASGKALTGRPALAAALKTLAESGASALVVSKLDRLARSVHDFAGLVRLAEKQGWGIVALDLGVDMTTPTGGLLANVTASVAEWERKIISLRTAEALAQRKLAGVRLGRPRLLDPQIAQRIRSMRAADVTLQAIVDRVERRWNPDSHGEAVVTGFRLEGHPPGSAPELGRVPNQRRRLGDNGQAEGQASSLPCQISAPPYTAAATPPGASDDTDDGGTGVRLVDRQALGAVVVPALR